MVILLNRKKNVFKYFGDLTKPLEQECTLFTVHHSRQRGKNHKKEDKVGVNVVLQK